MDRLAGGEVNLLVRDPAPMAARLGEALLEFQQKLARIRRSVLGALDTANELKSRLGRIKSAIDATPAMDRKWAAAARAMDKKNEEILRALRGDITIAQHNENVPPSIVGRVETIAGNEAVWLQRPPRTDLEAYDIASRKLATERDKLRALVEVDLKAIENALDQAGAPWTPGRLPLQ